MTNEYNLKMLGETDYRQLNKVEVARSTIGFTSRRSGEGVAGKVVSVLSGKSLPGFATVHFVGYHPPVCIEVELSPEVDETYSRTQESAEHLVRAAEVIADIIAEAEEQLSSYR